MEGHADLIDPFMALWDDVQDEPSFPDHRPLLAHYTSISTLEKIVRTNQLWFSNPLFMNDLQELRFGIVESAEAFRRSESIKAACGSPDRYKILVDAFEKQYSDFESNHAFDTYVFCLSKHDEKNTDGLLSMWRGYGGNGNGAAIVFDTGKLDAKDESPLIVASVIYKSTDDRLDWIEAKLDQFSELLRDNPIPEEMLDMAVTHLFERLKMFAIFTKHHGFSEEQEWRVVYMPDRDHNQVLKRMLGYEIGRSGVEPKLKLNVEPIEGVVEGDLSLEKVVCQILLGPSVSSPLASNAVRRMLENLGRPELARRLMASTTPYRPI